MSSILYTGYDGSSSRQLAAPYFDRSVAVDGVAYNARGISISADGNLVASIGYEGDLRVFSRSLGELVHSQDGVFSYAYDCALSPDASLLAVVGMTSPYLRVFNTSDWSEVSGISAPSATALSCDFSPDSSLLAVAHQGTNGFTVYNTADWTVVSGIPSLPNNGEGVEFSHDGQWLAFAHGSAPELTVFNTSDWSVVPGTPDIYGTSYDVAFSPDDSVLAVIHYYSPRITLIDTATWTEIGASVNIAKVARSLAYSPDGAWIAVGSDSSPSVDIIDTETWTQRTDVDTYSRRCYALAFTPELDIPTRTIKTTASDGTPVGANVYLISRDTGGTIKTVATDPGSGEAEIYDFSESENYLLWPDTRAGSQKDPAARVSISAQSQPVLELRQSYAGELVTISSNLTTQSGAPGDEVVIRNWTTRELVGKVIPDANGDWSAEVPPGTYDVSYIAENCAPVIHGPYTVELP